MASERMIATNQQNAKKSTGPKKTEGTRFNALRHGILSQQAVISEGIWKEDLEAFEELADSIRDDLEPAGALEVLLVDQLIMLTWRWRRLIIYETAVSSSHPDDWAKKYQQAQKNLAEIDQKREQELMRLTPEGYTKIYYELFTMVSKDFDVPIRKVLDLQSRWDDYGYQPEDVQKVIDATCEKAQISEDQFWETFKGTIYSRYEQKTELLSEELRELERQRLLATLPDERELAKVQRYEAHLSRQFHKSLHELQRLQIARRGALPSAPLAVDVDLDISGPTA